MPDERFFYPETYTSGVKTGLPEDPAERLSRELTDEDRELVDWIAEEVVSRRLTAPALFILESCKPLNYVSSQLMVVFSPLLGTFVPRVKYDRLITLLEKRSFVEVILRTIETRENNFLMEQRNKKDAARHKLESEHSSD